MHALPPTAPPAAAQARPYGFRGAHMGMSLAEWRASAPWRQGARCTEQRAVTVCRSPDQPVGKTFRTRELTSTFRQGRLVSIGYTTSVDGFADTVAELRKAYGDPHDIQRDRIKVNASRQVDRVRMTWRNGRSTIRLSDPTEAGARLGVSVTLDSGAAAAA